MSTTANDWIKYNHMTRTYNSKDGTVVAAELVVGACSLADVFHIADIRDSQRIARSLRNRNDRQDD